MAKESKLKFLTKAEEGKELKTVSARIPKALYDDFYKAAKLAQENGFDLSITTVMQEAMREAIKEVKSCVGVDKLQGDLLK
jgi:DNA-binding ferritin-like protein (Dps family)